MKEIGLIYDQVKSHLKRNRYVHTLGVIELSVELADFYGESKINAEVAALLHDYCKYDPDEKILSGLAESNFEVDEVLLNNPNLGHGFLASLIVQTEFGIVSEDIINAIASHTFGRKKMSRLEKIIYLADSLERNRVYDGIEVLRKLAFENLDKALLKTCESTILFEFKKGNLIHPDTIKMRNELLYNNKE